MAEQQVMGPGGDKSSSTTNSTSEKSIFHIEKLNNTNYLSWRFKMRMLLEKEECYDSIEEESVELNGDILKKDKKALQWIALSIENNQLIHVKKATGGRDAWKKLKEYHQRSSLSNQIRIKKRLHKYELKKGESMRAHLEKIFQDLDELAEMDATLEDKSAIHIILSSLNEDYDALITALEAWDEDKLTLHAVKMKLIEEFDRRSSASVINTRKDVLHWSAKKLPNSDKRGAHLYLDDFLGVVSDFQDTVAESSQGQYGVMDTNAVSGVPFQCSSPKELMNYVEERTAAFYISIPEGPISSGVKSETETFIKNVEKYKYLFDLTE